MEQRLFLAKACATRFNLKPQFPPPGHFWRGGYAVHVVQVLGWKITTNFDHLLSYNWWSSSYSCSWVSRMGTLSTKWWSAPKISWKIGQVGPATSIDCRIWKLPLLRRVTYGIRKRQFHLQVRAQIVQVSRNNKERFSHSVVDDTWEDYLRNMANDGKHADHAAAQATAVALGNPSDYLCRSWFPACTFATWRVFSNTVSRDGTGIEIFLPFSINQA